MLFYGNPAHHVAMYLGKIGGNDYMVEAPQSGDVVKVSLVRTGGRYGLVTMCEGGGQANVTIIERL